MEVSSKPAVEPENRQRAATLKPLVYRVDEIAQLLAISPRAAYNLCNTTKDFRVVRIGTSIRVNRGRALKPGLPPLERGSAMHSL